MREHTEKQAVDYKYSSNYLIQPLLVSSWRGGFSRSTKKSKPSFRGLRSAMHRLHLPIISKIGFGQGGLLGVSLTALLGLLACPLVMCFAF